MSISAQEAAVVFKQSIIPAINDKLEPKTFLRSIFKPRFSASKNVSIEVKRNSESVAVDVSRSSQGNLNTFGLSTQKIYEPPFFREYLDVKDLEAYNRVFGTTGYVNGNDVDSLVEEVSDNVSTMKNKIDRAYDVQCSSALFERKVSMVNGDTIDFRPKAASTITPSSRWTVATSKPLTDLETAINFIRTKGKARGGVFNSLMGSTALTNFLNTTQVKEKGDLRRITLVDISMPTYMEATGAVFHGQVTAGSYKVNIWTYPEFYDNAAGDAVAYVPEKDVVVFPEDPGCELSYAGVPVENGDFYLLSAGEFHVSNYKDKIARTSFFDVTSAGVALPKFVDRIAVIKAVA